MESQTVEYKETCRDEYLKTVAAFANTVSIFMRIYDKSVSIWNYGTLPPQLSVVQLKAEHSSFPRNRLIANTFFRAGYVETWGRGTKDRINKLKSRGILERIGPDRGGYWKIIDKTTQNGTD